MDVKTSCIPVKLLSEGHCDVHNIYKGMMCMDCDLCICGMCGMLNHKQCRTLLVGEAYEEIQEQIALSLEKELEERNTRTDIINDSLKVLDVKRRELIEELNYCEKQIEVLESLKLKEENLYKNVNLVKEIIESSSTYEEFSNAKKDIDSLREIGKQHNSVELQRNQLDSNTKRIAENSTSRISAEFTDEVVIEDSLKVSVDSGFRAPSIQIKLEDTEPDELMKIEIKECQLGGKKVSNESNTSNSNPDNVLDEEIISFLTDNGFLEYIGTFGENRIDFSVLSIITEEQIKNVIPIFGDRIRFCNKLSRYLTKKGVRQSPLYVRRSISTDSCLLDSLDDSMEISSISSSSSPPLPTYNLTVQRPGFENDRLSKEENSKSRVVEHPSIDLNDIHEITTKSSVGNTIPATGIASPSTPNTITNRTSAWHLNFELPQLPNTILNLMKNRKKLSVSHQDQIITLLYDTMAPLCNFYARGSQYEHVIRLLLNTYPALSLGNTMDVSMNVWKFKLQHKFKNRRSIDGASNKYVVARKRNFNSSADKESSTPAKKQRNTTSKLVRPSDSWGARNYLPSLDLENDENSMLEYKEYLHKMNKVKRPDLKKVTLDMDKTFPDRRKLVVTHLKPVLEVVWEYPWLINVDEMELEFYRILGDQTKTCQCLMEGLSADYEGLLHIYTTAKRAKTISMTTLTDQLNATSLDAERKELKGEIAFHLMASLLREDVRTFISRPEETTQKTVYMLKEENSFMLYLEGLEVPGIQSFSRALHLFMASFFIYNMAFSLQCHKTLLLILRRYFQLYDDMATKPCNVMLISKLNEFKAFSQPNFHKV